MKQTVTASKKDVLLKSQRCPPLNKSMMEKKDCIKQYDNLCGEVCFALFILKCIHSYGFLTWSWEKLDREGVIGAGASLLEGIRSFKLGGRVRGIGSGLGYA